MGFSLFNVFSFIGMFSLKKGKDYLEDIDLDLSKSNFLNGSYRNGSIKRKSWLISRLYGRGQNLSFEE